MLEMNQNAQITLDADQNLLKDLKELEFKSGKLINNNAESCSSSSPSSPVAEVTGVLGRGHAQENRRDPELGARPQHCARARVGLRCSGSQGTVKTRPELRSQRPDYMLR